MKVLLTCPPKNFPKKSFAMLASIRLECDVCVIMTNHNKTKIINKHKPVLPEEVIVVVVEKLMLFRVIRKSN